MTKGEEVYRRVNELVDSGNTKADAFKQLAQEYDQPVGSLRGSYYGFSKKENGASDTQAPRRSRRRETTPAAALADARAVLERAIASVDAEVQTASQRAAEAQAEYEAMRDSADARKAEITSRLEALA